MQQERFFIIPEKRLFRKVLKASQSLSPEVKLENGMRKMNRKNLFYFHFVFLKIEESEFSVQ